MKSGVKVTILILGQKNDIHLLFQQMNHQIDPLYCHLLAFEKDFLRFLCQHFLFQLAIYYNQKYLQFYWPMVLLTRVYISLQHNK